MTRQVHTPPYCLWLALRGRYGSGENYGRPIDIESAISSVSVKGIKSVQGQKDCKEDRRVCLYVCMLHTFLFVHYALATL